MFLNFKHQSLSFQFFLFFSSNHIHLLLSHIFLSLSLYLCEVPLANVKEIREGRKTATFKASTAVNLSDDKLCFSVIYTVGNKFVNLDLVAYSAEDKEAWVSSLRGLLRRPSK